MPWSPCDWRALPTWLTRSRPHDLRNQRRAAPRIVALPAPVAQARDGCVASPHPEVSTVRDGEGTLNGRLLADSASVPDTEGAHTVRVAIADVQVVCVFGDRPPGAHAAAVADGRLAPPVRALRRATRVRRTPPAVPTVTMSSPNTVHPTSSRRFRGLFDEPRHDHADHRWRRRHPTGDGRAAHSGPPDAGAVARHVDGRTGLARPRPQVLREPGRVLGGPCSDLARIRTAGD
ncbi:MAG: hypothetical protein O9972_19150 [Burkholderiales bacterium]|nr:hypothetical protein [Burkholderiales bacterium]